MSNPQQPYGGYAQQPPVYPPAPPPKKGVPVWVWLVAGFFLLCFMGAVAVGIGSWYVAKKIADNPLEAMVRIAAAANPDVEVLDFNKETGKVTVKDKKTGKVVTIDAETFGANGKITVESEEGKVSLDGGSNYRPPDWIVLPKNVDIKGGMTATNSGETVGSAAFTTTAPLNDLKEQFERDYKAAGFTTTGTTSLNSDDGMAHTLVFQDEPRGRTVTITLAKTPEGSGGTISFEDKQPKSN